MPRKDLTLLALGLADGKPLSPVQLQKAVFLLQERLPSGVLANQKYVFVPHNYGPFCSDVYADAHLLSDEGLITISLASAGSYHEYTAKERAVKRSKVMIQKLSTEVATLARELVSWVCAQSFRGLVSTIHKEYPAYRVDSIFNPYKGPGGTA